MAQVVNTNLMSLNSQRHLNNTNLKLATAVERLTSGFRINSAKDDAAGLAIADRMTSQIRGMNVAVRNANDAISLAQVAEGGLAKVGDALQRMRELAVQSKNATNSSGDRGALQLEFKELQNEISRVLAGTTFNGKEILGASAGAFKFQIGAGITANDVISINTKAASGTSFNKLGAHKSFANAVSTKTAISAGTTDASGVAAASRAIGSIDAALKQVNNLRARFGAVQNRFESVIGQLQINIENQTASRSRILDADFAAETAELTRTQILQQGGIAMLGQANQIPQGVMRLLG